MSTQESVTPSSPEQQSETQSANGQDSSQAEQQVQESAEAASACAQLPSDMREEDYDKVMQVPYRRYVANLHLEDEPGRKGIRFTMSPKIYRHKKIGQHKGVDVFQGFDDLQVGKGGDDVEIKVATSGKVRMLATCCDCALQLTLVCVLYAGIMWNFNISGGTKTMCVLCGFKLRLSPTCVLLVDEMLLRKAMAKGTKPDMRDFCKIQVHDLFHHGAPTDVVDLQVRDYAEQLKTFFLEVNAKDLRVWQGLSLVLSAERHNQIQRQMDAQEAAMQKKKAKDAEFKKKKEERERAEKKKQEERVKRREALRLKRKEKAKRERLDRRNVKRKLDRQVSQPACVRANRCHTINAPYTGAQRSATAQEEEPLGGGKAARSITGLEKKTFQRACRVPGKSGSS